MGNVALFVDYENIHWTAVNDYGRYPKGDDFSKLFTDIAKDRGVVLISKAYADWSYFSDMQHALASYSCQPIFVASKLRESEGKGARKNSADLQMTIDVMDVLHMRNEVDTYVFFSGDRDFLGLIQRLKGDGKRVSVCGFQTSMSLDVSRSASESVIIDSFLSWDPIVEHKKRIKKEKADDWSPLIKRIKNLNRIPVIYWHYLRKTMYWEDINPKPITRDQQDEYLNRAKEAGIIHAEKVPNPGPDKEKFPYVTAVYLNQSHPEVQKPS